MILGLSQLDRMRLSVLRPGAVVPAGLVFCWLICRIEYKNHHVHPHGMRVWISFDSAC